MDYGSYTEISFTKVDSDELIADYSKNTIGYLDFITAGFKKELQGILQSTHWVQSKDDHINVHINEFSICTKKKSSDSFNPFR